MEAAESPDRAAEQQRPIRISLVFDLDNQALGISVDPPPYPLSRLLSALPPEAGEVLGWLPDLAIAVSGFLVDPRHGAAGVLATAGLADSAEPSATLFLAETPGGPARSLALLLGLTLDSPISLGGTPLFGALLDGIAIEDLAVTWASAAIPAGTVILPRPAPPAADQPAYVAGPELSLTLREGANREPLRLRPPARRAASRSTDSAVRLPDPLAGPPVQWFPVEKRLGPLTIGRIGVVGTETAFGLALDASVRTASLSVRLTGFTVVFDPRSEISPAAVHVALDGLAVAFGSGKLKIDGGLVRTTEETDDGPVTAYAGALTIQAGPYGIAAIGSYAEYRGAPSMFVFGLATGRFGGVPAFFVTGLAAGFGYNRRLRLPRIDEVRGFPLVRAALRNAANPGPAPSTALSRADAGSALAELTEGGWVPIATGAYWVTAGIAFTSFGILDGFVMLVVQFGDRFIVSLLGVVGLRLPKIGTPVAYVELAIDAVFDVDAGEFQANALVTPNSFVFNRDGRLSGGFAFRLWFPPHEQAGDFVVSIGGYHPAFDKPDWYPAVPRLAIDWRVSPEIGISGDAYAALTPSAAMAGGNLDVRFAAGELRAWFIAHADLIVYWRPVFFEAVVSVTVGAEYTLSLGTIHRTLTIELGASLELWGPPFTGIAHVRWAVISFTVPINGGRRPELPGRVLDWAQFAADFLPTAPSAPTGPMTPADMPAESSPVCRARAAAGLLDAVKVGDREEWLVSADAFALLTETAIPASRLEVTGPDGTGTAFDSPPVGVYPMGSIVVETPHRVKVSRITRLSDHARGPVRADVLDLRAWNWSPVHGRVPYAVWGTVNPGRAELGSRLVDVATGLRGTPPEPRPDGPPPVPLGKLDSILIEPGRVFRLPLGEVDGSTGPPHIDPERVVRETIADRDIVDRRVAVTDLLVRSGIAAGAEAGRMDVLAGQVGEVFPKPPLLGPPGTTGPRHAAPAPSPASPIAVGAALRESPDSTGKAPRPPSSERRPAAALRAVYARYDHLRDGSAAGGARRKGEECDLWAIEKAYSLRAHVYDEFADAADHAIARRHIADREPHEVLRIDDGMSALWSLGGAARRPREVESDGALALRVTEFDAQQRVLGETRLALGAAVRAPISGACALLLVAAQDDPGVVHGWTAATALAQLAPQALVGPGVIVRPQCPLRIPAGGVRGSRAAGVSSGRLLSEADQVETPAGTRPGWIDTRFAEPPVWLRITLRPRAAVRFGSGPHGVPASVELRDAAGFRGRETEPVVVREAEGRLRLTYRVPETSWPEALIVRVRPDRGWHVEAVLGVAATGAGVASRADDARVAGATVVLR